MEVIGRGRELGILRGALDEQRATEISVQGLRGVGKSALVRRVVEDYDSISLTCPPLAEQAILGRLALALNRADGEDDPSAKSTGAAATPTSWDEVFQQTLQRARPGGRPFVLVLDDIHRLSHAHGRYELPLARAIARARRENRPFHVVRVGPAGGFGEPNTFDEVAGPTVVLRPLHFRAACSLLPGRSPHERIRAYALFGGVPRVLRALDPSASLGSNVRNLLLTPEAPLMELPRVWIERDVQNPTRYYTILSALASGERSWGQIRGHFPAPTTSGQIAPYLQRLLELGLIRVRPSLDARPGSRNRRYSAADPFLMTWFRFVFPHLHSPGHTQARELFTRHVRPFWDDHTAEVFPTIGRDFMEHDAIEVLGANARESGSIWGEKAELPVAGVLASGAAYYGHTRWTTHPPGSRPLEELDADIRGTRFAYGRERRLRLLFTGQSLPRSVQRAVVRRLDAFAIGPDELVG